MKLHSIIIAFFILLLFIPAQINYRAHTTAAESDNFIGQSEFCTQISDPVNVCIDESVEYNAAVGNSRPISTVTGILHWEFLSGITLGFFLNVSDIIGEFTIFDPDAPNDPSKVNWYFGPDNDRVVIQPYGKAIAYKFDAYYNPDFVGDTNFIVVFQSQVVNFPAPTDSKNGENTYYKVDYRDKITLPYKAGIVSYAPTDEGKLEEVSPDRFSITWEYRNRALDSKHNPLLIEVTYTFDTIYLQFTKLVYQNKIEKQQLQDQQKKLDILNASFQIIATLAVVLSIIAILVAYLLARKRYDPEKKKAKELPRRQASDVEKSHNMQIPVRQMFSVMIIVSILLASPLAPHSVDAAVENQNIEWYGQYEVSINTVKLTIQLILPIPQNTIKIWENMTALHKDTIKIYDELSTPLSYTITDDHIEILSPPTTFTYSYVIDYHPYNYSSMLVYIDRFWMEYVNPNPQGQDNVFLKADIQYDVIFPQGAIIYSASPSDKVHISTDSDGRRRVSFSDKDRQIDAFHDAWEMQVSYSFKDVFDAINDLDVSYENIKVETKTTQDYLDAAQNEILFFALLGIIAPLLSFLIAYWVFRKKNLSEIERIQQEMEENILVEGDQLQSMLVASQPVQEGDIRRALLGYYYLLVGKLSQKLRINVEYFDAPTLERELVRKQVHVAPVEILQRIEEGKEILQSGIDVGYDQLFNYAEAVKEIIKEL